MAWFFNRTNQGSRTNGGTNSESTSANNAEDSRGVEAANTRQGLDACPSSSPTHKSTKAANLVEDEQMDVSDRQLRRGDSEAAGLHLSPGAKFDHEAFPISRNVESRPFASLTDSKTPPKSEVPTSFQRSRSFKAWTAFVARQGRTMQTRIRAAGVRQEAEERRRAVEDANRSLGALLTRARDNGFSEGVGELVTASVALGNAFSVLQKVEKELREVEEELIQQEYAVSELTPKLFHRNEAATYQTLRKFNFDFRGSPTNSDANDGDSLSLSEVKIELDPEVEGYLNKLRHVDVLEERLLDIKRLQEHLKEDRESQAESGIDFEAGSYEILHQHQEEYEDILGKLKSVRAELEFVHGGTPASEDDGRTHTPVMQLPPLDRTSQHEALHTPMGAVKPNTEVADYLMLTDRESDLILPSDYATPEDGLEGKTGFVDSWLLDQLGASSGELKRFSRHLPGPVLQVGPTNVKDLIFEEWNQPTSRPDQEILPLKSNNQSMHVIAGGTPDRVYSTRSEPHNPLDSGDHRDLLSLTTPRVSAIVSVLQKDTQSLPDDHTLSELPAPALLPCTLPSEEDDGAPHADSH